MDINERNNSDITKNGNNAGNTTEIDSSILFLTDCDISVNETAIIMHIRMHKQGMLIFNLDFTLSPQLMFIHINFNLT